MKVAFYATETVLVLTAAVGMALGAGWAAEWLITSWWHPLAAAYPVGLVVGLCRGRRPLAVVGFWHSAAVQRLDGGG